MKYIQQIFPTSPSTSHILFLTNVHVTHSTMETLKDTSTYTLYKAGQNKFTNWLNHTADSCISNNPTSKGKLKLKTKTTIPDTTSEDEIHIPGSKSLPTSWSRMWLQMRSRGNGKDAAGGGGAEKSDVVMMAWFGLLIVLGIWDEYDRSKEMEAMGEEMKLMQKAVGAFVEGV